MKSYSKNFWLVCSSMFLFMTSFNLIIPQLNSFLSELGGKDQKGMIFILFTLSSALARPFSGRLSDHIGRKKVMYIGLFVCVLISLLYPLSHSVLFFLTLRFFHGFSAGFFPTGSTALVTDILPIDKRGIGMGIWGTFISLGIGVGQGLGTSVYMAFGLNNLFFVAATLSVISIILSVYVKESLQKVEKFNPSHLIVPKKDIIELSVIPAAIVMFLTAICSGILFVISPDLSEFLKIENKGWFFVIYVVCTILVRLTFGSLSDKIGRVRTLMIGVFTLTISMILVGKADSLFSFSLASIVFGIATGITSPTLFAWTADLSDQHRRGIGTGTMFIALELGIMAGSFSTMLFYKSNYQTVFPTFFIGVCSSFIAFLFLGYLLIVKKRNT